MRSEVTGLQDFCPASLFLSLLEKKNPLSLKTHYSSIGLLEGKKRERERERGGVNLVRGLGCN